MGDKTPRSACSGCSGRVGQYPNVAPAPALERPNEEFTVGTCAYPLQALQPLHSKNGFELLKVGHFYVATRLRSSSGSVGAWRTITGAAQNGVIFIC